MRVRLGAIVPRLSLVQVSALSDGQSVRVVRVLSDGARVGVTLRVDPTGKIVMERTLVVVRK